MIRVSMMKSKKTVIISLITALVLPGMYSNPVLASEVSPDGISQGITGDTAATEQPETTEDAQDTVISLDGFDAYVNHPNMTSEVGSVQEVLTEPVGVEALLHQNMTEEEYKQAAEDAVGASWGYTNLGISNVEDNLNIRSIPQEDGKLVGKLPKNAACEILEEADGWTHMKSGEVEGYVKSDYLLTGYAAKKRVNEVLNSVARVTADGLKVREEPNTDAEVITMVAEGESLYVIEELGEWVKVALDDQEVYVSSEYVELDKELDTAITMTEVLYGVGVSDVRVELCQFALQFVGNPYVWGGTSLTKGTDCSGFTGSVYKNFGMKIPRTSREQARAGKEIKISDAKPGDLIFYARGSTINHVAIYIGNGRVVHASNKREGIKTSAIRYRTPVKAVRFIQD